MIYGFGGSAHKSLAFSANGSQEPGSSLVLRVQGRATE
ncbi:hypothetical protein BFJ66_g8936 [Fusarium oxysporum f. sp. cepae]|uniref:Uncharacterized protein n=1 Tax=Fusarium oxysporum f. sp. cepae TaxID=396571 RepID=A0A3L6NLX2_FUSOX|nr:hypothetical protein BFJ65_g6277 [Fusarium oxysporum f. sp. cepae]RKK45669.1 hypothetical protein BFJ66_g8936 [Fusarium oxysporum f. sp. cepae]